MFPPAHLDFRSKAAPKDGIRAFWLQYTELYCTALHCTVFHYTTLNCTALHCIASNYIALCCPAMNCISLRYLALYCLALHCFALKCIAHLHCTALLHIVRQCAVVQYNFKGNCAKFPSSFLHCYLADFQKNTAFTKPVI